MRFGPVAPDAAEGAILAHSLTAGGTRLRKGRRLSAADVAALADAGIVEVTVARLEPGDVGEDDAAEAIARAVAPDPVAAGLDLSAPFTGRVNLFAAAPGVLEVDAGAVGRLNAVDPAITLATLPAFARVERRQMVATVKIIPYGATAAATARAAAVAGGCLAVRPFRRRAASLILTAVPGMPERLIAKGAEAVAARLRALGLDGLPPVTVPHETAAVAEAIAAAEGDLVLLLTGSATSDAADTAPAGLVAAGGRLDRFGMPVDPGNLLFLGSHRGRPVVGLPGCARSPALNGADWVLERLAAGIAVTGADIAAMGVGGLLKEIPSRPQPRAGRVARRPGADDGGNAAAGAARRPLVEAIVLAAGSSRRMAGRDKLLEPVGGRPALAAAAAAALGSAVERVIVVLPPGAAARRAALDGLGVVPVEAAGHDEGMAASLRAGLAEVSPDAEAVVVLLADMPEVSAGHVDRLIAAFDPGEGREIARALDAAGAPGHPVLFGRRFFENLAALRGDRGAREIVEGARDFVADVPTPGRAATLDLDTPEDWRAWRDGVTDAAPEGRI